MITMKNYRYMTGAGYAKVNEVNVNLSSQANKYRLFFVCDHSHYLAIFKENVSMIARNPTTTDIRIRKKFQYSIAITFFI